MTYAHLAINMRDADSWFKCFVDEQKNSIAKIHKTSYFYVKLLNGDEHCFMIFDFYKKWCVGRTYTMDGKLYHSGYPYEERREP